MSRPILVGLGIGAACFLVLVVAALLGAAAMPSYLGAWLAVLAAPLGAVAILMGLEFLPGEDLGIEPALRRLSALVPVAALLSLPVLFRAGALFFPEGAVTSGFPTVWMTPGFLVVRSVIFLAVWSMLGLAFSRPAGDASGPRRVGLAGIGLAFQIVAGTLAVDDWIWRSIPA